MFFGTAVIKKSGKKRFDWESLEETVRISTHLLDNVVDASFYPSKRVQRVSKNNRRLGLGVMGFANMLYELMIPYNSSKARAMATKLMKVIQTSAEQKSTELGKSKGSFPNFEKSVFSRNHSHDGLDHGPRRNAALTSIAPTGSISIMCNVVGGIEPSFALAYHYENVLSNEVELNFFNKQLREKLIE